jgi:hypothetical protein
MKKIYLSAALLLSTVLLMAGSNTEAPKKAEVVEIPKTNCVKNTVYKDHDTDLMWQDAAYTDAEDGAYKRNGSLGKAGNYQHARNYCNSLIYAGYADWRLPTSDELMTVHREEGQAFTNFRDTDFWTSTPAKAGKHFVVYPADAYRYERKASESNYIRCVRCMKD